MNYFGIFEKLAATQICSEYPEKLYFGDLAKFYNRFVINYVDDIPIFNKYLGDGSKNVLDLACGSGRIAIRLARLGHYIDGIEISEDMLSLFAMEMSKESPDVAARISVHHGDMTKFTLPKKFDLVVVGVTSISLLRTSDQRAGLFAEACRHLAEGGRLIFDVLNLEGDRYKKFDNFLDVWSDESDEGTEVAIIGQKFFPDEGLFCFNAYREFIHWDGLTDRALGSSTKVILSKATLIGEMEAAGLELEETFEVGDEMFFVAKCA